MALKAFKDPLGALFFLVFILQSMYHAVHYVNRFSMRTKIVMILLNIGAY
jgi:hypothetical protein